MTIEESIHVKFEESNIFIENVVEIDSLSEDMERITLKDSPIKEDAPKSDVQSEVQELKWSHHNHFQRIRDSFHIISRIYL